MFLSKNGQLKDLLIVIPIVLDLSATFDTVNHQTLQVVLFQLDMTATARCIPVRPFLVAWGAGVSESHQVAASVPHGSVLGPLLFSLYIASLGRTSQLHGLSNRS